MPTFKSYLTGFICSLGLTLLAFFAVTAHLLTGTGLIAAIFIFAVAQLIIQLIFFLHRARAPAQIWWSLFLPWGIIFIIVTGSLWIMEKLNYNMTPDQINNYMQDQQSF